MLAGAGGLALLLCALLLPWFGTKPPISRTAALLGASTSLTGWQSLSWVRWLVLLTAASAIALFFFQATRRSPAIPVSLSVIVTTVGLLAVVGLIIRVFIDTPSPSDLIGRKYGAYVGLAIALIVLYAGAASMRDEGTAPSDGPPEIPTVPLGPTGPLGDF